MTPYGVNRPQRVNSLRAILWEILITQMWLMGPPNIVADTIAMKHGSSFETVTHVTIINSNKNFVTDLFWEGVSTERIEEHRYHLLAVLLVHLHQVLRVSWGGHQDLTAILQHWHTLLHFQDGGPMCRVLSIVWIQLEILTWNSLPWLPVRSQALH